MDPVTSPSTVTARAADPLDDRPHSRKRRPRQIRIASASASRKLGRESRMPCTRKLQARRSPSMPVDACRRRTQGPRRVHLDPGLLADALEDRPPHQDRFERPLIGEPAAHEVDGAQLGDRIVRVADPNAAGEPLGEVAEHEDKREGVGLVAGHPDEPGGGQVAAVRVIAGLGGDAPARRTAGRRGRASAASASHGSWSRHSRLPMSSPNRSWSASRVRLRDAVQANVDDPGHAVDCTVGWREANPPSGPCGPLGGQTKRGYVDMPPSTTSVVPVT